MAKIRAHFADDPYEQIYLSVIHYWWTDPYEAGAYHEIYPYTWEDQPLGYACGQQVLTIEEGLIAAETWASRPAMINDICVECRFHHVGANTPRWNIYRGEEHPKWYPGYHVLPARFIPGFVQDWRDPYPPGYGPPP